MWFGARCEGGVWGIETAARTPVVRLRSPCGLRDVMQGGCFVYILKCADGKFYVGNYRGVDLATRIGEHNSGHFPNAWTHTRRPVHLVWSTHFERITDAISYETQIKKWSRAKKEALIAGDFEKLKALSQSKSPPADLSKTRFPRK